MLLLGACFNPSGEDKGERPPVARSSLDQAQREQAPDGGAAPTSAAAPNLEASDHHYGIYLNGHKVGWMRSQTILGPGSHPTVELKTDLLAQVAGMGQVSEIKLQEYRTYHGTTGALESIDFEQRAATGAVRVQGRRSPEGLLLTVEAGGKVTTQTISETDTLDDATSLMRLAAKRKVGATATSRRFDPSILKSVTVTHRVEAIQPRVLGGVEVDTVEVSSDLAELGIRESAWVDAGGTILESKVGGFFVARLEAPEVAKKLEYQQDLLISAVVESPEIVARSTTADAMTLVFEGFGANVPEVTHRQKVESADNRVTLRLTRDPPPEVPFALPSGGSVAAGPELESTPFIQSDDPEIIAKAREVIGDAKDVFTATSRLVTFVFDHVRDEYVPAYSNALDALRTRRGDCTEHAILFVALARAVGIPARVAVGIAYWPAGQGFGWHAWAQVRAGETWYSVDPTWNQFIADVTHIRLAGGGPAEQARIVMLLGKLRIVDATL